MTVYFWSQTDLFRFGSGIKLISTEFSIKVARSQPRDALINGTLLYNLLH